jgi:hypothetical protein
LTFGTSFSNLGTSNKLKDTVTSLHALQTQLKQAKKRAWKERKLTLTVAKVGTYLVRQHADSRREN